MEVFLLIAIASCYSLYIVGRSLKIDFSEKILANF